MSEKRRSPRVRATKQIWLEGQETLQAETMNLSKGGMFVLTQGGSPEVGQELVIKLEDSEEGQIDLKMEVVWRAGDAGGVGLRALDSDGQAAFERVVNRHIEEGDEIVPETPSRPPKPE